MTNEKFVALVDRLEQQARRDPAEYRTKVVLLALLGNAYLVLVLLSLLAVLGGLVASLLMLKALAVKLAIVVGVFLWMVAKALCVRIEAPAGRAITATQAPELFALVDRLRRKLGARPIDRLLITDDLNAGVVQVPRLGIFGWPRRYLLVGLPLLNALGVEQLSAVLAHELGHLTRDHGRTSNWVYRQRLRWGRLQAALEARQSRGSFLFKPFLNWFAPYFNAFSFPMARANEYEADAAAVRLTSPQAAAMALTTVEVVSRFLAERYWPQVHGQADDLPQPDVAPYGGMAQGFAEEIDPESAANWIEQAMTRGTGLDDTHPALRDRLAAIGQNPQLACPPAGASADRLLGSVRDEIIERFDKQWRNGIGPSWQLRHSEVQAGRQQLAELNQRSADGEELALPEAYERARLCETLGKRPADALTQFAALAQRFQNSGLACFAFGARLLRDDDGDGRGWIERAMQLDESFVVHGCEVLRDYCWRQGRRDEALTWHERFVARSALEEAAQRERSQVLIKDRFTPHELAAETLAELQDQLASLPGVRKAYLVKKEVEHFPQRPCYVFGFSVGRWFQWDNPRHTRDVLVKIQSSVRFPGNTLIVNVEGDNYRFGRKFRRQRGARIL